MNGEYDVRFKHIEEQHSECKQERINDREIIHARIERNKKDAEEARKDMEERLTKKFDKLDDTLNKTNKRNITLVTSITGAIMAILIGAFAFMYQSWHNQQNVKYQLLYEKLIELTTNNP